MEHAAATHASWLTLRLKEATVRGQQPLVDLDGLGLRFPEHALRVLELAAQLLVGNALDVDARPTLDALLLLPLILRLPLPARAAGIK